MQADVAERHVPDRGVDAARHPGVSERLAADGIRLTRHGNLIDIHVDITVTTTQPANLTAEAAHETLRDTVTAHQLIPGEVTVTVLRLNPDAGSTSLQVR